ncbi:MAG: hypothetical protein PHS67_03100 [Sphaerochaetaceae bacterium]|nr:hypothetical protein [Sphaerochaetaceae bacterium]
MKRFILPLILLLSLTLPLYAFDGFTDIFDDPVETTTTEPVTGETSTGFGISGTVGFSFEAFSDIAKPLEAQIDIGGGLNIDLSWRGSIVDASVNLSLNPSLQDETLEWIDVFTGLSITTYFEGGRIEVGRLKKEWGSGDGVHVVDVLNAPDYRNGIVDDTLAMKVAEPMLLTTALVKGTTFEIAFKPMLIPMLSEEDPNGRWFMLSKEQQTKMATMLGAPADPLRVDLQTPDKEDLAKLSKAQYGARVTRTMGPFDLGLIYYNGYYYEPGYDFSAYVPGNPYASPATPPSGTIKIDFTRAQLFGAEATFITGPLTFMAEGGFWLSEDMKGTEMGKYNNKWVYLAGVGLLVPGTSTYATLTYNGHYIMDYDDGPLAALNADNMQAAQSSAGKRYMNTLTAAMEIPLARDTVVIRLAGTYQIETHGYALLPSVTWNITDDLVFKANARVFGSIGGGKESIFETWKDNDALKLGISYLF